MDFELDPQVREAVEHPAATARGPEELQLRVRLAGEPARRQLGAHWESPAEGPDGEADRFAAAVLLATLFDDRFWLERAAAMPGDVPGCPSAPPRGLLELTRVPGARAAMAPALERSLLTGLLEWATKPLPEQPPIAVAEAARDLGIHDDGRVYRGVRRSAERMLAREHDGSPELERLVAVLRQAEKGPGAEGPAVFGEVLPPRNPDPRAFPGVSAAQAPPADPPEAPRWGEQAAPPSPADPRAPLPQGPVYGPAPGATTPGGAAAGGPPPAPGVPEGDPAGLKNWGALFLVIVAVILLLVFIL